MESVEQGQENDSRMMVMPGEPGTENEPMYGMSVEIEEDDEVYMDNIGANLKWITNKIERGEVMVREQGGGMQQTLWRAMIADEYVPGLFDAVMKYERCGESI